MHERLQKLYDRAVNLFAGALGCRPEDSAAELYRMMTGRAPQDPVDRARELLQGMDDPTFYGVLNELGYAFLYHSEGASAAGMQNIDYNRPQGDGVQGQHWERSAELRGSRLNHIVRAVFAERIGDKIPEGKIVWALPNSSEDVPALKRATRVLMRNRYRELPTQIPDIRGNWTADFHDPNPSKEQVTEAEELIASYGISGALTGDGDPLELFLSAYAAE